MSAPRAAAAGWRCRARCGYAETLRLESRMENGVIMDRDFTLFVVDDDPAMRALFSTMFADRYGIEVFAAAADCLQTRFLRW